MTRVQDIASASSSSPSFASAVRARSVASSSYVAPVASPTHHELQVAYNAGVAHATAEIDDLHISDDDVDMVDQQAQQCQFHNVFSLLPKNDHHSYYYRNNQNVRHR